jgi:hypothetical protein
MKLATLILFLFIFLQGSAQEDYTIYIDGVPYKVALNNKYDVTLNGKKVSLSLKLNDTLTYSDQFVSFLYPSGFSVSRTQVDGGLEQVTILTADGSGLIIQKHTSLNPTTMNEMLLSEMTKESVGYGYVLTRQDYKKKIISGQTININKAVLKYKDEVNIYEVTSLGKKDEGVIVMTIKMDDDKTSAGQKLIDLMWSTLRFK